MKFWVGEHVDILGVATHFEKSWKLHSLPLLHLTVPELYPLRIKH